MHLIVVFKYVFLGNYCPVCRKCYEENDYESEVSYMKYVLISNAVDNNNVLISVY